MTKKIKKAQGKQHKHPAAEETKQEPKKESNVENKETAANPAGDENQQEFTIQRIYIKDSSFESPNSPAVFRDEWKPNVELELNTQSSQIDKQTHEVVIKLLVTVKNNEKTAFLVEVQYAGIFSIDNFDEDQLKQLLGSYCPNILYPYAREAVSDLVVRGGFPPLALAPVNFDALYAQHLQSQQEQQAQAPVEAASGQ